MSLEDVDVQGGATLDSIVTTTSGDSTEGATFLRRISATNSSVDVSILNISYWTFTNVGFQELVHCRRLGRRGCHGH